MVAQKLKGWYFLFLTTHKKMQINLIITEEKKRRVKDKRLSCHNAFKSTTTPVGEPRGHKY